MRRLMALCLSSSLMVACQSSVTLTEKQPPLAEAAFKSKPDKSATTQPLAPVMPLSRAAPVRVAPSEPRMDIAVDRVPIQAFIQGLAQNSRYNLVLHPGLTGEVSFNLKQVTLPELLDLLRDLYGYDYRRRGNTYQLLPAELRTLVIPVNYLNLQRIGTSRTRINSGQISDKVNNNSSSNASSSNNTNQTNSSSGSDRQSSQTGTEITTETHSDLWLELQQSLQLILGSDAGQQVVVSPQTGMVIVKALPQGLRAVQDYLDSARLSLARQVILEAKVLEVSLDDGYQAGIDWQTLLTKNQNQVSLSQVGAALSPPASPGNGIFSIGLAADNFQGAIRLLQSQGQVQVLSSPRVSTLNNQKAVIKVGTDEFFVTGVSTTTTTGGASTQVTPDLDLTPFFSGIALDVTPQIAQDGDITLHIHPTVSRVQDQVKTVELGTNKIVLPLALSSIRESDSIVRARSGQLVVIGGLMQENREDDTAKAPGLASIPVLGKLFTQVKRSKGKSDLVILLRPWIVDDQIQQQQVDELSAPLLAH